MTETRRILLDGTAVSVVRDGDYLVAGDGRRAGAAEAVHLAPVEPTKIIAVHVNDRSRVKGSGTLCPLGPGLVEWDMHYLDEVLSTAMGGDWPKRGQR